jgi:hypothetical protein
MVGRESTPLLQKNGEGNTYYFEKLETKGSFFQSTADQDGGKMVETLPPGSNENDFAPRALGASSKVSSVAKQTQRAIVWRTDSV